MSTLFLEGDAGAHFLVRKRLAYQTHYHSDVKNVAPPSPTQELRHFPREKRRKENLIKQFADTLRIGDAAYGFAEQGCDGQFTDFRAIFD